jgi:hypothetical protein
MRDLRRRQRRRGRGHGPDGRRVRLHGPRVAHGASAPALAPNPALVPPPRPVLDLCCNLYLGRGENLVPPNWKPNRCMTVIQHTSSHPSGTLFIAVFHVSLPVVRRRGF